MCAHRKNGPRVHTTSAGTDTHRPMCVDLMPWVRDRGVYAQQKGWGQGGPGLQLTCRMGISLSSARHSSSRRARGHGQCSTGSRPGSQQSPPLGPHPQPPQEPPLRPPISVHLFLCCPHAVPAQPCSPASLFLGRVCPLSLPASQCPP